MRSGNGGSGGSYGQLVLDYRRDRTGGMRAAVGASAQSEVDDGADQQDRQVGHSRIKYPATQRPVADGVDSAGELARAAGADAPASGVGGAAHALEESHHRHAGQ